MTHIVLLITILIALISCDKPTEYSTPAQKQIDEYTNTLKNCKEEQKPQNITEKSAASTSISHNIAIAASTPNTAVQSTAVVNPKEVVELGNFLKVGDSDIILGDPHSKVTVVEYFSPTCTHCAYYHKSVLPEIKNKYIDTNKIAYVLREFISNKQDLDAAILARCSQNTDSFLKFIEVLLQQQGSWAWNSKYREILTNIGQLGGVGAEDYAKCLNDEKLMALLISNSKKAFQSPKFIGTPAFFINGVQFTSPYTFKALSEAIDKELGKNNNH